MTKYLRHFLPLIASVALFPTAAGAAVTYNSWTTNEGGVGNYNLTLTEIGGDLKFDLTVNPWNAEALGLFLDLGTYNLTGAATLSGVSPVGQVSLFATDTTSDSCGTGCNLNGLNPPVANPDNEWEFVFRLGSQGFNSIQTFAFLLDVAGTSFTESQLGLVGIRAQQLCNPGSTLPSGESRGACDDSDKAYGLPSGQPPTGQVPLPGTLPLLGLGLAGLVLAAKRRN